MYLNALDMFVTFAMAASKLGSNKSTRGTNTRKHYNFSHIQCIGTYNSSSEGITQVYLPRLCIQDKNEKSHGKAREKYSGGPDCSDDRSER